MNTIDRLMELAKRHEVDQYEAYLSRNRLITIRMALNEIVEAKNIVVEGMSVRLVVNDSIGFASSTDLSEESLKMIGDQAYNIAKSKKPDPDFKSLPEPKKATSFEADFDKALIDLELDDAVEYGRAALKAGLSIDSKVDLSGSINIVNEECQIRNSLGVDVSDKNTFVFSSITAEKGEEASAVGQNCSRRLKDFSPIDATNEAVENISKCMGGKSLKPGKYDVIFGPHSCADLTEYILAYGLDLSAIDSSFSYFRGKLGEQVASEVLTVTDDGRHPEGIASKKVDDEGVPTQKTDLIKTGILTNFLCDAYYSNKVKSVIREFESTGNGFRFGAVPGRSHSTIPRIQPTNFIIEPRDISLKDMIKDTRKGILLGRIWYTYPINPTVGEFSTTNRGNTFYIENGEIKHPILPNSFRINDSLPKLLRRIVGITKDQTQSVVWGGISSCISPHIKFSDVSITYSKE